MRARLGSPKRLSYGTTPIEALDLYPAKRPNAPVHVFIHGGAWRTGSAKNYAFQAEMFVHAGAHFVTLDFQDVTQTGGDLMPMADQVRRAVAWVSKNAASFGGDPNRIYISGHSSGGHLARRGAGDRLEKDFGLPNDVVKGALLCSGMYDLKPVRLSARSSYVKFTDEMEHKLSTQRHLDKLNTPVILAYGTLETPEFQRQIARLRGGGAGRRQAGAAPGRRRLQSLRDHRDARPIHTDCFGRAVLEQMKLKPA